MDKKIEQFYSSIVNDKISDKSSVIKKKFLSRKYLLRSAFAELFYECRVGGMGVVAAPYCKKSAADYAQSEKKKKKQGLHDALLWVRQMI